MAADHPDPDALRQQLDELVERDLPGALAHTLQGWSREQRIVLIQRLELDLLLNVDNDPRQLIGQWTRGILQELAVTISAGSGEGVVQFDDISAYHACFLRDLLRGDAWGRWYYRRFEGLRMLPLSAAARTLLCDGEADIRAVLGRMSESDRDDLLAVLNDQDAARISTGLAGTVGEAAPALLLNGVTACLQRRPELLFDTTSSSRLALRVMLDLLGQDEGLRGAWLVPLLEAVARLLVFLTRRDALEGEQILHHLRSGNQVELYRKLGSEAARWLPLLQVEASSLQALVHWVVRRSTSGWQETPSESDAVPRVHTRHGGLFLLLPLLDTLPLEEITEGWPDPQAGDSTCLLRLLLVMKALGQPRAGALFFDPLLRTLLGIPPAVTPKVLSRWQEGLTTTQLQRATGLLHAWQFSSGIAGSETAVLASVRRQGGPVALLIDSAGGWLGVSGFRSDRMAALRERFDWLDSLPLKRLLLDPRLSSLSDQSWGALELSAWDGLSAQDPPTDPIAETLARLDRLSDEIGYLSLPPAFRGPRQVDLTFNLFAHGLLRTLARRLPGFSRVSLPYLYRNFLELAARCEGEDAQRIVQLGRPPLQLVLGMTGLARGRYRLSWLPDLEFELHQSG